jgi:hypothetical protein
MDDAVLSQRTRGLVSPSGVVFCAEPVVGIRLRWATPGRCILWIGGCSQVWNVLMVDRLSLDPHLVPLPGLSLSHHLGNQIAA